jgi:hypothetical protein
MSKQLLLVILAVIVVATIAGCRGYGYRPYFAGGPHLDYVPFFPVPVFINHGPVPYAELKEIYPPEYNISGF